MQQLECQEVKPTGVQVVHKEDRYNEIDPRKITATTIIGNRVKNTRGEELGKIEEIVIDLTCGTVSYVVLSSGGFAGIGDKFFSIPLDALIFDTKEKSFFLKIDRKSLKKSRGFDKFNWPLKAEWPL